MFFLFPSFFSPPPPSCVPPPRERAVACLLYGGPCVAPLVCTLRELLTCYSALCATIFFFRNRVPSSHFPSHPSLQVVYAYTLATGQLCVPTETLKETRGGFERLCRVCDETGFLSRDFSISSSEGFVFSPLAIVRFYKDDIRHVATAIKKCVRRRRT